MRYFIITRYKLLKAEIQATVVWKVSAPAVFVSIVRACSVRLGYRSAFKHTIVSLARMTSQQK